VLHAGLYAAISGMEMITLFNVDLVGEDDKYTWINTLEDETSEMSDEHYEYEVTDNRNLIIEMVDGVKSSYKDSVIAQKLQYNLLREDSPFLKTREGKDNGKAVIAGLQKIISNLSKADDFIRNSRSENSESIIKLSSLTDVDDELFNDGGTDRPNFAADFNSLTDIIDFIEKLMTQQVDFNEEKDNGTALEFSLNIPPLSHSYGCSSSV
jgi:hypothetical protein